MAEPTKHPGTEFSSGFSKHVPKRTGHRDVVHVPSLGIRDKKKKCSEDEFKNIFDKYKYVYFSPPAGPRGDRTLVLLFERVPLRVRLEKKKEKKVKL